MYPILFIKPHKVICAAFILCVVLTTHAQTITPEYQPESLQTELPKLPDRSSTIWIPPINHESEQVKEIDEATLLAQPKLLNLLLDKSVLNNDMEGIRILLPVYHKLPETQRDNILIHLANSKLSMYEGKFSQAISDLRAIIAAHPELDAVRMYLAIALFYDHQDVAAKDQFDKLMAQTELPDKEKQLIKKFTNQLQQRHQWQFDGGINYTHEPNINNAPLIKQQGNINTDTHSESANGIIYRFNAQKDWALPHSLLAKFSADVYGRYYPTNTQYNDLLTEVSTGMGYRNALFDVYFMPFIGHRWWQGDAQKSGLHSYSRTWGVNLGLNTQLNHQWRIHNHARIEKVKHQHRYRFDGIRKQISTTLIYQSNPRQAWFSGISHRREDLHDVDNGSSEWTASLGWIQEWKKGFSTRSHFSFAQQKYHAAMPWPILYTRKDHRLQWQLSAWHRNIHFWGVTPRITWQYIRNKSNVFLYDYRKNNLFIEFSKTF